MRPGSRLFTAAAAVTGVSAIAAAAGTLRWNRATAHAVRRLHGSPALAAGGAGSTAIPPDPFDPLGALGALPAPVRRYFAFALAPGQMTIQRARLQQDGVMRADGRGRWNPFRAVETFSTSPIGFVWDATIDVLPLLSVRVRDAYIGGQGTSDAGIGGIVPIRTAPRTSETDAASLLRYLAESPWFPTALLPEAGVRWTELDDDHARATLTDSATTVSMDAEFGHRGEIIGISAMRYRDVKGVPVLTPWSGRFHSYARIDGMMIPASAEVEWRPPEGAFSVWRGYVLEAEYEFAP